MKTLIGLETKWECPSCENILNVQQPFWAKDLRKKTIEPVCGCGRKDKFKLINLKSCHFSVIPKGYQLVDSDGQPIEREKEEITKQPKEDNKEDNEEEIPK